MDEVNKGTLALDLGTATGWAFKSADGVINSGVWDFRPRRFEGGGMRYLRFRQMLDQFAKDAGELGLIAFEEVRRHQGVDAAHVYGGLMATLTAWCESHSIPYCGISIGTWKKNIPGLKGNASKQQVMDAITALGFKPASYDEADALGVLYCVCATARKSFPPG